MTDTPPSGPIPDNKDDKKVVVEPENDLDSAGLFDDLPEEETLEEVNAEQVVLRQKLEDVSLRLDNSKRDYQVLTQQMADQKKESTAALAQTQLQLQEQVADAQKEFLQELSPALEGLTSYLSAIPKEQRTADVKFDRLAQGIEKITCQLTAAFNKFGNAGVKPQDGLPVPKIDMPVTPDKAPETVPDKKVVADLTAEEVLAQAKAERDRLRQQQINAGALLADSQRKNLALIKQIALQKEELERSISRIQNQIREQKPFALEKMTRELLPAVDNLERALNTISAVQRSADPKFDLLARGIEETRSGLAAIFNRFGIQEINPKGEMLDPDRHEAIGIDDTADVESDTVVAVAQKGYELNGRIIRHAKVVVKP